MIIIHRIYQALAARYHVDHSANSYVSYNLIPGYGFGQLERYLRLLWLNPCSEGHVRGPANPVLMPWQTIFINPPNDKCLFKTFYTDHDTINPPHHKSSNIFMMMQIYC